MDKEKITLNKDSFMALASQTRVEILKRLDERQMTVSELSRKMGLSKPAILDHLKKLIDAELVNKKGEKGRKWIYYKLTMEGKNILHPERVKITVLLSTAFLSLIGGIIALWGYAKGKVIEEASKGRGNGNMVAHNPTLLYIGIALVMVCTILMFTTWWTWKNKKPLFETG